MVEAVKAKGRSRGRHKAYINQISLEAKEFTVGGQCITDTQPLNCSVKVISREANLRELEKT